jgi:ATP-binding cassette subfamily B protein/subfamily B ATP-binding cassette protein MsbA
MGETVAVVGPNGCGKSTLVNLLPRFYDPKSGSIELDGLDLRQLRVRQWRDQISIVPQETLLFDDTVMNNIRYGSWQASDAEVMEAAVKACAHEFIVSELPDGYQTVVGEGGGMLSGGQRQRIALARAFLRDAPILILDEATSNIDAATIGKIYETLSAHLQSRTGIIITHRASDLALADRIVVMKDGKVVDIGGHQELLARCAVYQHLHAAELDGAA